MTTRSPAATDFFVDVPGVGRFRYGRQTFGDRIRIRSEFMRLTGGFGEGDLDLGLMGTVTAKHIVQCVQAPPGWDDIEALDSSLDPDQIDKHLLALHLAVKEKEDSFRRQRNDGGQGSGSANGAHDRAVVPPSVQPGAA
jgi:hypothetical protein